MFSPRAHCSAIKLMRSCCGSVRAELTSEPTFRVGFGYECCKALRPSAGPHGLPLTKYINLGDLKVHIRQIIAFQNQSMRQDGFGV